MKKNRITEYLAWIPAVLIVVLIFVLSSQNGDNSKETSGNFARVVADRTRLEVDYNDIENLQNFDAFNQFIRTLAHMTEYAVLSLCVGLAVSVNGFKGKMRFIYMCLLSGMVSVLDEFYQIFIPGRYGDLIDIFFDCFSVFVVAVITYLLGNLYEKQRKKNKNNINKENHVIYKELYRRKYMSSYIDSIKLEQVLELFKKWLDEKVSLHYIVTPNADHMVQLEKNKDFRKIYDDADLILPDGAPLMWIAESLGNPLLEKIPGSDLLPVVCKMANENGYRVFILGGQEGVAKKAAEKLKEQYSKLQIAGFYSPDMNIEKDEKQQRKIVELINESKTDILVVALGAPKQEKFIYKYKDKLKVSLALPIGAAVDFAAETVNRAPKWMRKNGLEWFYRFMQEPGRLFRRYFIDDMKIFWLAWKYRHQIKEK